ncbi:MAG: transcriptional regulator [Planctomycetes bacterium]|nr:transcriptional regulator [Planctomycetota bacterium]
MKVVRLQRVLRLMTVLQSERPHRPDELAKKMNVSRRTFFRDLEMLTKAGIPYNYDSKRDGYVLDKAFFLPPLHLKLSEALSLLLLVEHLGRDDGMPLMQGASLAAAKIESVLPAYIKEYCGTLIRRTSIRLSAPARHDNFSETFSTLQKAVRQRRKVEIGYESFFEKRRIETTLNPYHIHYGERAWYVIGHSFLHGQVRMFKVARIRQIKMLESIYLLDKPFRIEEYFGKAWSMIPEGKIYHVKLRFLPMVAGNVAEVIWHQTQKLARHTDGSLTFEADVDGLKEISWWIMGYADQVEVLEPQSLRRRIAQMAEKMVKTHNGAYNNKATPRDRF